MGNVAMVGLFEVGDAGVRLVGTTKEPGAIEAVQQCVRPSRPGGVDGRLRERPKRRRQVVRGGRAVRRPGVAGVAGVGGVDDKAASSHNLGSER